MSRFKLNFLNGLRWVRENIWVWGLLALIYSLTLAHILEAVLELSLKKEYSWKILWPMTWLAMLFPWFLHRFSLPGVRFSIPTLPGAPLVGLFLRHELRRGQNYFSVILAVVLLSVLPVEWAPLVLLIGQIPVQQGLYSIQGWRVLALSASPQEGARQLVLSFVLLQLILGFLMLSGWVIVVGLGRRDLLFTIPRWIAPLTGAWIASSCAALEGDAGRGWLVNFIGLAAGLLGGFIAALHPLLVIFVAYGGLQMVNSVKERLRSIEFLDEDTLIP